MITRTKISAVDNFTIVPNAWARDAHLSRRARGLLAELLSHKVGWQISIDALVEAGPEGKDAIRKAVRELETAGYLKRDQTRGDSGKFGGTDYLLQDPEEADSPSAGNPSAGNPMADNPPLKKTTSSEEQVSEDDGGLFVAPAARVEPVRSSSSSKQRATQIPDTFVVTAELEAWAKREVPEIDWGYETGKFRDYHTARGSRFTNWPAAWRNWMRNAQQYKRRDLAQQQRQPVPAPPANQLGIEYEDWA